MGGATQGNCIVMLPLSLTRLFLHNNRWSLVDGFLPWWLNGLTEMYVCG